MMDFISYLVFVAAFFLGASIGSFLNVLIDRLPRGEGIFLGRSYCESCKKKLKPIELIPLFSYLALKGKCGKCKGKIPFRIFLVELITGISFVLLFLGFLSGKIQFFELIYLIIIISASIGIFFSDYQYGIIPDEFVIVFGSVTLIYSSIFVSKDLINQIISGIVIMLFFLTLFFITKQKGMGFGDVKLSLVLGLFLGFPKILVSVYLSFLTGAFVSIILVIWGIKKLRKDTIPFGPFLIFSALVSYFWGETLIAKFLELLG